MKTCVILVSLIACNHSLQKQVSTMDSGCLANKVICVIDLVHFYDPESECGYEICVCKEAVLVCKGQVQKYPASIKEREVQCIGTITNKNLKMALPPALKMQQMEEPVFTVHEAINIVNAEREIVYKIRPGNYRMCIEADELYVVVELEW